MNCKNCNSVNPESARFCSNCGQPLTGAPVPQSQPAGGFDLDRFLPRELQVKLEATRASRGMAGERRIITMLFCDVKGSTAAAEQLDPEEWTEIINGAFEHMIRPIYKYEGLVPRLMGDAILAFFGAPIAHEDDPQRAVLAGLEIQAGIQPYADQMRVRYGVDFGLRVGINTGLVVVGEIGSDLRMEYTAIGDAINLAARMEQTAAVGTVQISDDTYKLVAPFFEIESLGEVEVKGKSAPVKTWRVLGVKASPGQLRGLDAIPGGGLSSPLVGREAHLSLLNERLENLSQGTGSVVAVIGEAGLGKSTLIAALKNSESSARFNWLTGDALSYARSISYFPWRQVIRQSVDAHEDDSPAEVRHKLGYVCDCCTLPGGDIPFLEAMLAVESEASAQVVMGFQGDALTQRMVDATRGYLCGLAAEGPLVIVFDDLHWADEASSKLLLDVVDLNNTQPILFLCMSRPEPAAAGWDAIQQMGKNLGDAFHSLELAPLQSGQTETLLNNLLGEKSLLNSIRDLIVNKAEGNPFFVEEIIRSLIETRQIVRANSHWIAMGEEAKISLPNTLRGLLGARIDRLPEESKHVLQNAAVIGRSFDARILKRLTGLNGGLDAHLQFLQGASLIEALRGEYAFRHVLIQEAAYESVLIKKRAELHRQIAEIIEELHADRLDEFAPLLAHHFYAGQDERSLRYDVLAGEKSARLYANAEAATHFRRALEVARRVKAEAGRISGIYTQLGSVLELGGRYEQALEIYAEMESFGRDSGERSIELTALVAKATIYSTYTRLHDSALSEQTLTQALEISRAIGDRAVQVRLHWNLMLTYLFSNRLDPAKEHGEIALGLVREIDNPEYQAFVLNDLCRLYTCRGEFEKAHVVVREARELWRSLDNQVMLADSFGSEAEAFFNAGEFESALAMSREALQVSEKTENLWGQSYDNMLISFVLLENGSLGPGIRFAEQSIQLADRAGLIASSIALRAELAWVYAYCGAYEKGLPLIEQAIRVAEEKQPGWRTFPQAAQVRMDLLNGDLPSAERSAGRELLEPIPIPYARYAIFISLANIELAVSRGENQQALSLINALLDKAIPLTRVDIPDVLRWKGIARLAQEDLEQALQTLTEARSLSERLGSKPQEWLILASLADVNSKLGKDTEAEANLTEARRIVSEIAESLREVGLRESFLGQSRVQQLMR